MHAIYYSGKLKEDHEKRKLKMKGHWGF